MDLQIPEDLERLGDDVELVLFRILQESLTNVHRHSGSKTATVELGADSSTAWLEVRDRGTAHAGPMVILHAGIGITGMRERLRDLSGELQISSDGTGTRVRARIPLAHGASGRKEKTSSAAAF